MKVEIRTAGSFWELWIDGRKVYKSKDREKVKSRYDGKVRQADRQQMRRERANYGGF